jgi:glycosyltransferase involved in cell wall biosynthesis
MLQSLGIPPERIALLPNVVDNQWWRSASDKVDRAAVRSSWNIQKDARVIVFSAKLQEWKRPAHLLQAFAQAQVPNSFLIIAGEGPSKANLEAEAKQLGVSDHVRFLGFVNQSQSVFVSAGRFAFFLVPAWLFAFGFSGYLLLRSRKRRLLSLLAVGCISLAIVMCASRGTSVWPRNTAGTFNSIRNASKIFPASLFLLIQIHPWAQAESSGTESRKFPDRIW